MEARKSGGKPLRASGWDNAANVTYICNVSMAEGDLLSEWEDSSLLAQFRSTRTKAHCSRWW
jgi:hypothetical protein